MGTGSTTACPTRPRLLAMPGPSPRFSPGSWTGTTRRSAGHLSSAMSHPDLTGTSDTTHTDQCPTLEDPTTTSLLLKAIKSCRSVWKIKITDQQLWVLCTLFKVILSIEYKLSVIVLFRP